MNFVQRKDIIKKANSIKSKIILGKNGITNSFIKEIENWFSANEIIKVKFNSFKEHKIDFSQKIADLTRSKWIFSIGNTSIYYKINKNKKVEL